MKQKGIFRLIVGGILIGSVICSIPKFASGREEETTEPAEAVATRTPKPTRTTRPSKTPRPSRMPQPTKTPTLMATPKPIAGSDFFKVRMLFTSVNAG